MLVRARSRHQDLKSVVVELLDRCLERERQRQRAVCAVLGHRLVCSRRLATAALAAAAAAVRAAVGAAVGALAQPLELEHHLLPREVLLVALLEVEGSVVERLCPVLLVHLLPALGQLLAQAAPLLVLLLQPLQHEVDRGGGALVEQLDHLQPLRAVEPADALAVHSAQRRRQLEPALLGLAQRVHLLLDGREQLHGGGVGLDGRVELEALVLRAEDGLLVLVLSHRLEVEVFGPSRDRDPVVVEDELFERPAARADGRGVVVREDAVRGAVLLHRVEIEVAEGGSLGDGRARGLRRGRVGRARLGAARVAEEAAEGGEQVDLRALEEVTHERHQLGALEDL
eukprot:3886389-Pleurochrysis_carterae.AAC.1